MEINLSKEIINTVYEVLNSKRHNLKWWLEVSLPNGKVNPDKKEEMEQKLYEVENALQVFEELMNGGC